MVVYDNITLGRIKRANKIKQHYESFLHNTIHDGTKLVVSYEWSSNETLGKPLSMTLQCLICNNIYKVKRSSINYYLGNTHTSNGCLKCMFNGWDKYNNRIDKHKLKVNRALKRHKK